MNPEDEAKLDRIYEREQELAARLADQLRTKAAWDALERELQLAALELGKQAVIDALPFLQVALRLAILAA